MALSRKMLQAMDIQAEKIDEIINAHAETVNALKEERDSFKSEVDTLKAQVEGLQKVEKDLEKANEEIEKFKKADWEGKYNDVKGEYDTFKKDTETKATKAAKVEAYKKLLTNAGIPEKRIPTIMKVSDVDSVELDDEGEIKDAETLTESVKTEWADFIPTEETHGASVPRPPKNNGGDGTQGQPSRAAQLVAQYRNEHYGNPKED